MLLSLLLLLRRGNGLLGALVLALGVCLLVCGCCDAQEVPTEERNALLDLFEGTGGTTGKWLRSNGWNSQNSTCTWYGVTCSSSPTNGTNATNVQHVVEIDLVANGLAGIVPASLGDLSQLLRLYLSDNELVSLPNEIGELILLEELELDNNNLTKLPDGIGSAVSLQSLVVDSNQIKILPESIGSLDALMFLSAKENRITAIPEDSFSGLENLVLLDLSGNRLSAFPEIGGNTQLVELRLNDNRIKGRINDDVGDLQNLEILALEDNQITSLPDSLADLQKLRTLTVQNNRISSLPLGVGSLDALTHLDASSNKLVELPISFGGLESLLFLSLSNNKFETLPDIVTANSTLRTFYCSQCSLTGAFPSMLFNITTLDILDLSENEMSGSLPDGATRFPELDTLDLTGNSFSGPMPLWFANIDDLTLTGNHFRCPVLAGLIGQQCVNVPVVSRIDPTCVDTDEEDDIEIELTGTFFLDTEELTCKFGSEKPDEATFVSATKVTCELSEDVIKEFKDGETLSLSVANYGADYSNVTLITFKNKCKPDNNQSPSKSDSDSESDSDSNKDSDSKSHRGHGGLPGWAVALIVIFVGVGIATIGGLYAIYMMRRKRTLSPYGADTRHVALLQDTENL